MWHTYMHIYVSFSLFFSIIYMKVSTKPNSHNSIVVSHETTYVYCISLLLGWWGVGLYGTQWEIHARLITSAAVWFGIPLPVISLYIAQLSTYVSPQCVIQSNSLVNIYVGQSNSSYSSHPCLVCLLDLKARIHVAYIHAYVSFTLCFSSIWSQKQLLGSPILQLWLSISSREEHPMWVTATSFNLLLPSIICPPSFLYNKCHN